MRFAYTLLDQPHRGDGAEAQAGAESLLLARYAEPANNHSVSPSIAMCVNAETTPGCCRKRNSDTA